MRISLPCLCGSQNMALSVVYSQCHGERRFDNSILRTFQGIQYVLLSQDYLTETSSFFFLLYTS